MALRDHHPEYTEALEDWEMMRDTYAGERAVKERGLRYLPATSGMWMDGMDGPKAKGRLAYDAYKTRAVFHDYVSEAVELALGFMWSKPPVIVMPEAMEPLRESATTQNESLQQLLRRINEQQLVAGRLGLLADMPVNPDPSNPLPYIAVYTAESVINWDVGSTGQVVRDSLNLVVLDETQNVRQTDFSWETVHKYRVLVLGDVQENEPKGSNVPYRVGLFEQHQEFSEERLEQPTIRGRTLDRIPFTFINSKDLVADVDNPPLMGLARHSLTIYRAEADYRQGLFMQAQDTLVLIGDTSDEVVRTGAGAVIRITNPEGDAKYVGVDSTGLTEQREALENDHQKAAAKSGQLTNPQRRAAESGDALQTRLGAQTATLRQIAMAGAGGLERTLRQIAVWIGANPDQVEVKPYLDFAQADMTAREALELQQAKNMGLPLSDETIHDILQKRGMTDLEYEEEREKMESEGAGLGTLPRVDDAA